MVDQGCLEIQTMLGCPLAFRLSPPLRVIFDARNALVVCALLRGQQVC